MKQCVWLTSGIVQSTLLSHLSYDAFKQYVSTLSLATRYLMGM
jgi:hypothetical protein